MPRLAIARVGDVVVELDHAANGRVNSMVETNNGATPLRVVIELTDGRTFEGTTSVSLPNNAATVAFNANEVTVSGIAYIRVGG